MGILSNTKHQINGKFMMFIGISTKIGQIQTIYQYSRRVQTKDKHRLTDNQNKSKQVPFGVAGLSRVPFLGIPTTLAIIGISGNNNR